MWWLLKRQKKQASAVEIKATVEQKKRWSFFSTPSEAPKRMTVADGIKRAIQRTAKDFLVRQSPAQGFGMDSGISQQAQEQILSKAGAWYSSQAFIGHQMCAILAQNWLVDKACTVPVSEAVAGGYKVTLKDDTQPEAITAIESALKKININKQLVEFGKFTRVFGIRVALVRVDSHDPDYYNKPFNIDGVTAGSYRGITQVDPAWCTPVMSDSSIDPTSPNFYEADYFWIGSKKIHRSHLVIARGPEVADMLKPTYQFGGIPLPQLIWERVFHAEQVANEAPKLAKSKRLRTYKTDIETAMANRSVFDQKMQELVEIEDNFGFSVLDRDDAIEQHDTGLADLDDLIMTQYQLVAAIANMPATKLLGTTPKGFNATGEAEAETYRQLKQSIQCNDLQPLIERVVQVLIRSEVAPSLNIAPFDVDVCWLPLDSPTAKEQAEIERTKAETAKIYAVDIGAVDSEEVREKLKADPESGFNGLQDREPPSDDYGLSDGETTDQ